MGQNNDKNPNREAQVMGALSTALNLTIDVQAYDLPFEQRRKGKRGWDECPIFGGEI